MAACDPGDLYDQACENHFPGVGEVMYRAILLQLLCNLNSGTIGTNFNLQGDGDPTPALVAADPSQTWTYFDRLTGVTWTWNNVALAWQ